MRRSYAGFFTQVHVKKILETTGPGIISASDWSTVRLPVEEVEVLCAGEPLLEPVLVGNGLLLVHLRLHDDGRHHEYGVVIFTVSIDFV